ncbi:5-keto-2-deoxy-D-gluconate-6 phosphate aldolase [Cutibacterium acnes JCM 18916]|nr:5-keto-2-deoxy-D-gluconate-6 phosphate aldolase [Cutibacterium acnes JCM 18916]
MVADLANLDALDGKVVFGSMNRGGFAGASFELDDRMTGYDVQGILDEDLTGGKMLLRFDLSDPGTATTAQACAGAVTTLARARRIAWWNRSSPTVLTMARSSTIFPLTRL